MEWTVCGLRALLGRKYLCLIPAILFSASDCKLIKWNLTCQLILCEFGICESASWRLTIPREQIKLVSWPENSEDRLRVPRRDWSPS